MGTRTALLIDFGSTYTKLRAVDVGARRLLGSAQGPSTVKTDITEGLHAALDALRGKLGTLPAFDCRLASSSTAGGLRMVTVGLVPQLTAEAARRAALGAGARLVATFAYRLTRDDLEAIAGIEPDIVLLAGGTDGGNSDVLLHNARALGASRLTCPVVLAGNRAAADEAAGLLGTLEVTRCENVMPELNRLNIEPARAAIRQVFLERIVHAKGIDRAREMFDEVLMPTPAAVLEGAALLADGPGGRGGLGPLLVVDPGGATTDVHSVAEGKPADSQVILRGLPEPYVKRTVEGDLGMRHNIDSIVAAIGIDAVAAETGIERGELESLLHALAADVERLPSGPAEAAVDRVLAATAIRFAVRRHAGSLETVYTPTGPATVQYGKDLSGVAAVIGTGGVLAHSDDPGGLLRRGALRDPEDPFSLCPAEPRLLLDGHYILYACGLLAAADAEAAFDLAMNHLSELDQGDMP